MDPLRRFPLVTPSEYKKAAQYVLVQTDHYEVSALVAFDQITGRYVLSDEMPELALVELRGWQISRDQEAEALDIAAELAEQRP